MNAIGLHHSLHAADTVEQERHPRRLVLVGELLVDGVESVRIGGTVVRRQAHTEQQHACTRRLRIIDDALEVRPGHAQRQPA